MSSQTSKVRKFGTSRTYAVRKFGAVRFQGRVVRGRGVGRRLGFPTANLKVKGAGGLPTGVFTVAVTASRWPGPRLGVLNIGTRPTFGAGPQLHVEVHLPGWHGRLYGCLLRVRLEGKLRDERRFPTTRALKAQIRRDIRVAMETGIIGL